MAETFRMKFFNYNLLILFVAAIVGISCSHTNHEPAREELVHLASGGSRALSYSLYRAVSHSEGAVADCDLVLILRNAGGAKYINLAVAPGDFNIEDSQTNSVKVTLTETPQAKGLVIGQADVMHLRVDQPWTHRPPFTMRVKLEEPGHSPWELTFTNLTLEPARK